MERHTEKSAADVLLDRGVKVSITAPFFYRWFGKKRMNLYVRRPRWGTGLRISSYYISTGITEDQLENITAKDAIRLYHEHGAVISKIVAVGILNGYVKAFLFTKVLAFYLREYGDAEQMCALANFLIIFGSASPFMDTIRSVHALVITAPNLSQTNQGS